jgi:hypothetical protein
VRNISATLTTEQILNETKDVTRRLGWTSLKAGDRLQVCKKCQGIKKGEKIQKLKVIECVDVRREPLNAITRHDVRREGFPGMTPKAFVEMFCGHMKCEPETLVTRIEFKYVE